MNLVHRKGWGARPATSTQRFTAPAKMTYVHHSVTSLPPSYFDLLEQSCKARTAAARKKARDGYERIEKAHMRYLQEIAFGRGFSDISYSFVVFPSGNVYKGRGFKVVGAHTQGSNSTSHAICFVGNFEISKPTPEALESAGELHAHAIDKGHTVRGAPIKGHREAPGAATACPGRNLQTRLGTIRKAAKEAA